VLKYICIRMGRLTIRISDILCVLIVTIVLVVTNIAEMILNKQKESRFIRLRLIIQAKHERRTIKMGEIIADNLEQIEVEENGNSMAIIITSVVITLLITLFANYILPHITNIQ